MHINEKKYIELLNKAFADRKLELIDTGEEYIHEVKGLDDVGIEIYTSIDTQNLPSEVSRMATVIYCNDIYLDVQHSLFERVMEILNYLFKLKYKK